MVGVVAARADLFIFEGREYRYGEVYRNALRYAAFFLAERGRLLESGALRPGERFALGAYMENTLNICTRSWERDQQFGPFRRQHGFPRRRRWRRSSTRRTSRTWS